MSKEWKSVGTYLLMSGGHWDDIKSSIKAKVFGRMVMIAEDNVYHYRSDMYHDALWLNDNITGEMEFEWIARESGTFIGDVAHINEDDWPGAHRYKFSIYQVFNNWMLDIHKYEDTGDWREVNPDTGLNYYGNPVTAEFVDDYSLPKEYHPYFSVEVVDDKDVNPINASIDMLFEAPGNISFPTPRNETTNEPKAQRKVKTMDDVREMLEEKLSELTSLRDEINDAKEELENAEEINDRNIETVEEAINALDFSLDDVYVSVDLSFSS